MKIKHQTIKDYDKSKDHIILPIVCPECIRIGTTVYGDPKRTKIVNLVQNKKTKNIGCPLCNWQPDENHYLLNL